MNFQCRGVLLIWINVGQEPTSLAVGASGGCLDIFFLIYLFSFSLSLAETKEPHCFHSERKASFCKREIGYLIHFWGLFSAENWENSSFFFLIGKGADYWPQIGPRKIPEYVWFITSRLDKKYEKSKNRPK